jgi:hypothetical protein
MDNQNILKLLNSKQKYNSNVFSLVRNNEKIKVMLKGTKYFETKPSNEYLVDIKRLLKEFPNFSIVEKKDFSAFKDQFNSEFGIMNTEESKFSFLNTTLVLKKM